MKDVLLYTRDAGAATREIRSLGGRVTHQLTSAVLVAEMPDEVDPRRLSQAATAAPRGLDATSRTAAKAWRTAQTKRRRRLAPRGKPLSWDTPGYEPPLFDERGLTVVRQRPGAAPHRIRSTGTATSLTLDGAVAVGVIVVSGAATGLKITAAERTTLLAEVQEGLDFLAKAEPNAKVSFVYDLHFPTVAVPPGPSKRVADHWPGWPASFADGVDAAVMWDNGKAYFFRGSKYLRYSVAADKVDAGYPRAIAGNWAGFPASFAKSIDAAVRWNNGKAYFFKGSQYLRFDVKGDKVDSGYPKPIAGNWQGFPAAFQAGIDGVVLWPGSKKAYFFRGAQYLRFDVAADKVDAGYPKPIAGNWKGWPAGFAAGIDAGVVWNADSAYFFRGDAYIRHDVTADHVDEGYEAMEAPWRDAAVQALGFTDTTAYVKALRAAKKTKWAYAAYFTKYPLHHFAYAYDDRLVMHHDNDGWGVGSINAVFAHETCHVFGAADEYAKSGCTCDSKHGLLQVPNRNCTTCAGDHVPCLMDANTLSLCVWSRAQLGWNYGLDAIRAAALWPSGKAYFFADGQYLRYDVAADKADPGYPRPLDAKSWPGWPVDFVTGLDAAVVWPNGKAYFFRGDRYLRYDLAADKVDPGYPRKIAGNWKGFPSTFSAGIDAAVTWPNGKAYFFKGKQYLRFDLKADQVDAGWPKPIAGNWKGFPAAFAAGVDAAVAWPNGKAYFFKGAEYLRFDLKADKVDAGWPKQTAIHWPGLLRLEL